MTIQEFGVAYNQNPSSIAIVESFTNLAGITNANPGVVTTAAPHEFTVGELVLIRGVAGMTEVNGLTTTIASVTSTTFTTDINTNTFGTYTSGGVANHVLLEADVSGDVNLSVVFDDTAPKDQIVMAAMRAVNRLQEGVS